ncbi:hypothetical protein OHB41_33180 [Streptomyces sp. NBC_01571]|uniref:hypothetical protein n=1 Tax=Streptomyces sp. NBC_01571 TaxID=2975883 RepID=UPI0022534AD2|nr:hypothetical protein [Streptomyces sp. NBC_01571]MCX4577955.1 hypothetical protein [Streptomyces sp. NBC_01571]
MPSRYCATMTPDRRNWVILDLEMWGYCTLKDEHDNLLPLEWRSKAAADAWLRACFQQWQRWEMNGEGQAPTGWRPFIHPSLSPFQRHIRYNK